MGELAHAGVRLNQRFVDGARRIARAASVTAAGIGLVALAGWVLDVETLKGFYAGITMKANAAVAFILTGASLRLYGGGRDGARQQAGLAAAVVAGAIGAATLLQHLTGRDLGIDQLLFRELPGAVATTSPGRMGPPASLCFALAGFALTWLHARRPPLVAQCAALVIGLAALLAITGYSYGVESLYGMARYTGIALHTAGGLLALSVGILAATADRGIAAVLVGEGAGSVMARRLLGVAILLPLLVGWLRVQLENAGYIETRFGVAGVILVLIVLLSAVIVSTAIRLNTVEGYQIDAEARLRARLHELESMMEVAPIGLFMTTDRSAQRITGNRVARELLRMAHADDNLSVSAPAADAPVDFRIVRAGVDVPQDQLPVQRAAREGVTVPAEQLDVLFADGEVRHLLVSALPLRDEHGNPRGAVGSTMDVTARIVAEREREELLAHAQAARAQAEEANRAKDEFLATVSHELRTPLNAILGWASMLREGIAMDGATRQRALATIERNCRAQMKLIDDILDVSRIVTGQLRLDIKPVDLQAIVNAAVDVVRPAADTRGIAVAVVVERIPPGARGDAIRLQQVVWNLLANAVKFSEAGGLVEVRLGGSDTEAHIAVTDGGVGIDPDFVAHVFERFRQADSRKTRRHGGLGLGLAIARHLVEMHGGTIAVESDGIGRGARFTVRVPVPPYHSVPTATPPTVPAT